MGSCEGASNNIINVSSNIIPLAFIHLRLLNSHDINTITVVLILQLQHNDTNIINSINM